MHWTMAARGTSAAAARTGAEGVSTGFVRMRARMQIAVPPVWTMNPQASLLEQLDTLVMRYVAGLRQARMETDCA
mgnify:FL=1